MLKKKNELQGENKLPIKPPENKSQTSKTLDQKENQESKISPEISQMKSSIEYLKQKKKMK